MKQQKSNLLTYGLLLAAILGSLIDRPSKTSQQITHRSTLATYRWQPGSDSTAVDERDEHTIIVTRFLFPEDPKNPVAFR